VLSNLKMIIYRIGKRRLEPKQWGNPEVRRELPQ